MKETYYFSHDTNAREDPKILQMCSVYGAEGYGWYWMILEMMAEQSDYRLDMRSQYACNAIAMRLYATPEKLKKYLNDCVDHFKSNGSGLFCTDAKRFIFWSDSLIRRMAKKGEKSEKARASALARWGDTPEKPDADAMRSQCDRNAIKESKVKENKENIYMSKFNEFWAVYPRKKQKNKAQENWSRLVSDGQNPDELIRAARSYASSLDDDIEERFIKLASTFLGPDRPFTDYLDMPEQDDACHQEARPEPHHPPLYELPGWEGLKPADLPAAPWAGEEELARKFGHGNEGT